MQYFVFYIFVKVSRKITGKAPKPCWRVHPAQYDLKNRKVPNFEGETEAGVQNRKVQKVMQKRKKEILTIHKIQKHTIATGVYNKMTNGQRRWGTQRLQCTEGEAR